MIRRVSCTRSLSRLSVAALTIVLTFCPWPLLAQRGGGRGTHGNSPGPSKSEPGESDELKDFSRAIALQATPEQVDLFQQLSKDTTAAADKARNLAQHPENMKEDSGILAYVVEVARDSSRDFLAGLSHAQKSGLKAWRKNVEKADIEVGKTWKALSKDMAQKTTDEKQAAADNDKLEQALTKSFTEQWNLALRMGIPRPKPDSGDRPGAKDLRPRVARDGEAK